MVCKKSNGKKNSGDHRSKWPQHVGEYVHFLVYKEAVDTLEASLKIAGCLHMSPSNLTYAGVKDKRGKTTQWFCIRKVNPKHLLEKTKPLNRIKIGNITFKDTTLKIGQLLGNVFKIALRNVVGDDELIAKSLKSLGDNGFINYYGLQRFGNDKEVPTYTIGIQLLLGNWQQACNLILKPLASDNMFYDVTKAKKIYAETKNVDQALRVFGGNKNSCIEYLLLAGLSKGHANDFVNALTKIPRNTRLLYIHAFQSLIWNKIASKRIEKFGVNVVEGDLILLEKEVQLSDVLEEEEVGAEKDIKSKAQARALGKDECDKYTIYDIVLPLPGYDIIYPEHLRDEYKEALEEHGLTLEMTKQKVQTYSLSGTYRKLIGKVKDLSWKITHYNDPNDNLIRSDYEELKGEAEPPQLTSGTYKALILEFSLASSSYATMVLREIMKTDTSSSSHAKLNDYHLRKQTAAAQKKEAIPRDEEEMIDDEVGLLKDKEKYELFKRIVFAESSSGSKRKLENDDSDNAKQSKVE